MKIIHFQNIAYVGSTLVNAFNNIEGVSAIFFDSASYTKNVKDKFRHFKKLIYIKKLISKEKPDILHVHYLTEAVYMWLLGKKYILHVHGGDVRGLKNRSKLKGIRNFIIYKISKMLIKNSQLVMYSTPDLKEDVEFIRKDAIFIPNPVKLKPYLGTIKKLDPKKINILFFASLSNIKGADIAFPAFVRLNEIYKEKVNIVCIDFGFDRNLYNKFPFITYIDKLKYDDVNNFISSFDIVIGQLKVGAIGVSELEVMMQEIPLISYFKYNEFYDEECPFISCNTSDDVVKSVSYLINNEEYLRELVKKQYNWVSKYHSDKNVAKRILFYYENLIKEN